MITHATRLALRLEKIERRKRCRDKKRTDAIAERMVEITAAQRRLRNPNSVAQSDALMLRWYRNGDRLLSPAKFDAIIAKYVTNKGKTHPLVTMKEELDTYNVMSEHIPFHVAEYVHHTQVNPAVPDDVIALLEDPSMTTEQYYDTVAKYGAVWGLDRCKMYNQGLLHKPFRFPELPPLHAILSFF
jgi:hypothetical protein